MIDESAIWRRANNLDRRWDWLVTNVYGPAAKPPKVAGELAIETCHQGSSSAAIEVSASRSRADIGRIYVLHRRPNGSWHQVGYWDGERWDTTEPTVCRG